MSMTIEQAKSELMQIYGALSPDKQRAIDTLVKIEPCKDAISRQAVIDVWHTSYSDNREENEKIQYKKIAFELPSVNPQEPKVGHWIVEVWNNREHYTCSVCQKVVDYEPCYHYCPYCGAKMESEVQNESVD